MGFPPWISPAQTDNYHTTCIPTWPYSETAEFQRDPSKTGEGVDKRKDRNPNYSMMLSWI